LHESQISPPGALDDCRCRRVAWWLILVLTADFIYGTLRTPRRLLRGRLPQWSNEECTCPLSEVQDGKPASFTPFNAGNQSLRFLIIKKPNGFGTGIGAPARICGAEGYRQGGTECHLRHCGLC